METPQDDNLANHEVYKDLLIATELETFRENAVVYNEPVIYAATAISAIPEYTITMKGNKVSLKFDNINPDDGASGSTLRPKEYNIDDLKNFTHDFTYQPISAAKERPFKTFFKYVNDGNDNATPDLIVPLAEKRYLVMEFTTRQNEGLLREACAEKRSTYLYALQSRLGEGVSIVFCVVAVSSNRICTNLQGMTSEIATELCFRYRLARDIYQAFRNANLVPEFFGDEEKEASRVRIAFNSVTLNLKSQADLQEGEKDPVTKEVYESFFLPPDKDYVDKLESEKLKESLREVTKCGYITNYNANNVGLYEKEKLKEIDDYIKQASEGARVESIDMKAVVQLPGVVLKLGTKSADLDHNTLAKVMENVYEISNDNPTLKIIKQALDESNEGNFISELESISPDEFETLTANFDKKDESEIKHLRNTYHRFRYSVDMNDEIQLATDGINAKKHKENVFVKQKRDETKIPYSINHDTSDIQNFIDSCPDELTKDVGQAADWTALQNLVSASIGLHNVDEEVKCAPNLERYVKSSIGNYCSMITDIGVELSLSTRQNCKPNQMIIKKIRNYDIFLIIKPTTSRSHIFVSFFWNKSSEIQRFEDHTFRHINEEHGFCWTDFVSFNESKLINLVKCQSMIMGLIGFWHEIYQVPPFIGDSYRNKKIPNHSDLWKMVGVSLLTLLHDKTAVEEVMTDFRFVAMEGFVAKPCLPNPGKMIEKLRLNPRSRLEVWVINKVLKEMSMLIRYRGYTEVRNEGEVRSRWLNLRNPYTGSTFSNVHQLISIFYLGYLKNKEEKPQSNVIAKLYSKILSWEDKVPDSYDNLGKGDPAIEAIQDIEFSASYIKVCVNTAIDYLKQVHGPNILASLEQEILVKLARTKLIDLCTLKASSQFGPEYEYKKQDYDEAEAQWKKHFEVRKRKIYDVREGWKIKKMHEWSTVSEDREFQSMFDKDEEVKKDLMNIDFEMLGDFDLLVVDKASGAVKKKPLRCPRRKAVEAIRPYLEDEKNTSIMIIGKEALEKLEIDLGLFVDLFQKSQHGGIREIYVLSIDSRLVQLIVETMARVICSKFDSETMTNPKSKSRIPENHTKTAKVRYKEGFLTMATNDDAKKWNQGHYATKFMLILCMFTPKYMHGFIVRALKLWLQKKIMIDPRLIEIFQNNPNLEVDDQYLQRMNDVWWGRSKERWMDPYNNYIKTESGMMQGILHYNSSLLHTVVQIRNSYRCKAFLKKAQETLDIYPNLEPVISVMQSSDDSAMMISMKAPVEKRIHIQTLTAACFFYKSLISIYAGIYPSVKCTRNTRNVMEFNSEFHINNDLYKPVLRWVAAIDMISEQEMLASRQEEMSNLITNILEGGGSFHLAHTCQLAQCLLYYKLLGMGITPAFNFVWPKILRSYDPSLGFFLFDHPFAAGLHGFNYNLWNACNKTCLGGKYHRYIQIEGEGGRGLEVTRAGSFVRAIVIPFGNRKKYLRLLKNLELSEHWLDDVYADPEVLYRKANTTKEMKTQLAMKMHAAGVAQSLSSGNSLVRIISASLYMILNKVFTDTKKWYRLTEETEYQYANKISLAGMLQETPEVESDQLTRDEMLTLFPNTMKYEYMQVNLNQFRKIRGSRVNEPIRKVSSLIEVIDKDDIGTSTAEKIVSWKWFGFKGISMADRIVERLFQELRLTIPWLRDTVQESLEASPFDNHVQLRNFIARLESHDRTVRISGKPLLSGRGRCNLVTAINQDFFPGYHLDPQRDVEKKQINENYMWLKHMLYMVASIPLNEPCKQEVLRDLINSCPKLQFMTSIGNTRRNRLAIIQEFVNLESVWTNLEVRDMKKQGLLQKLFIAKAGIVGGYSIKQVYDPKTRKYEGEGTWVGQIDDLNVSISVLSKPAGNVIQQIVVDSIQKLSQHMPALKNLCEEMNFVNNETPPSWRNCEERMFNFKISPNISRKGCPIFVMENKQQFDYNLISDIKLLYKRDGRTINITGKSGGYEITILSFTVTESDIQQHIGNVFEHVKFVSHPLVKAWVHLKPLDSRSMNKLLVDVRNDRFNNLDPEGCKDWLRNLFSNSITRYCSSTINYPSPTEEQLKEVPSEPVSVPIDFDDDFDDFNLEEILIPEAEAPPGSNFENLFLENEWDFDASEFAMDSEPIEVRTSLLYRQHPLMQSWIGSLQREGNVRKMINNRDRNTFSDHTVHNIAFLTKTSYQDYNIYQGVPDIADEEEFPSL